MTRLFCLQQDAYVKAYLLFHSVGHRGSCRPAFNRLMLDVVSQCFLYFIFCVRKIEERRKEEGWRGGGGGGCGFHPSRPPYTCILSQLLFSLLCWSFESDVLSYCPGWSGPARPPDDWSISIVQVRNHHNLTFYLPNIMYARMLVFERFI